MKQDSDSYNLFDKNVLFRDLNAALDNIHISIKNIFEKYKQVIDNQFTEIEK